MHFLFVSKYISVFGTVVNVCQISFFQYTFITYLLLEKLTPDGDAPVIGGLLMGLAGVVSCMYSNLIEM